jgi:predicted RNA-binding protein with PUA-like domain
MASARKAKSAPKQYWLAKTEPEEFSWERLVREKTVRWDGVRSFQARNNLRRMKLGDVVLFYHSGKTRDIVGLARVTREAYPDPTAPGEDWSVVEMAPIKPVKVPVTLAVIKADPAFADFLLVRRARLSVMPASAAHFERILRLGETKL